MGEKNFTRLLNAEGTQRLRVRIVTRKGRVVEFTIQLETMTADK